MRPRSSLVILLGLFPLIGCAFAGPPEPATPSDRSDARLPPVSSIDGLERVEISLPGILELRSNHGIGSYDALLIPDSTLSYKRGSLRLTRNARQIFLSMLTDSLVESSTAAGIPVVDEPGECVMQIHLDVVGLNLALEDEPEQLAELTLQMEFQDSTSQRALLRYATENRVPNPSEGVTPDHQLKKGLVRMVRDMDLAGPFRGAGLADDDIHPACNGTLAKIGRAAQQAR